MPLSCDNKPDLVDENLRRNGAHPPVLTSKQTESRVLPDQISRATTP